MTDTWMTGGPMQSLKVFLCVALLTCLIIFPACSQQKSNEFPVLKGSYLGQEPPGMTPEVFAPGIISRGFHELSPRFSPDGSEFFYIMSDRNYSLYVIVTTHMENGVWTPPEVAPFSGDYTNNGISYAQGGNTLAFSSKRPIDNRNRENGFAYIWIVERHDGIWGTPECLEYLSETRTNDMCPSISKIGNMYFQRQTEAGKGDIYMSRKTGGTYSKPQKVEYPVSSDHNDGRPYIAPDESYILFQSSRPGGFGSHDIYVCYRNEDGVWSPAINLGEEINSPSSDFGPFVSWDGKYLFFTCYRPLPVDMLRKRSYSELMELYNSPANGYATIYWVDAGIIEKLKSEHLK